jgi:putative transposase
MADKFEYERLKTLILSTRLKMIGAGSKSHWLNLHKNVREALKEAFVKLNCEQIAEITGFTLETIKKWEQEKKIVNEIKQKVNDGKVNGRVNVSKTASIRPDICALAKISKPTVVAEEIGLGHSSVIRWLNEGWDEGKVSEEKALAEESDNNIETDIEINTNVEIKQLEIFLERHKGKARKKYSLAEKKLILEVVDRFGSKAVHDRFKVSYDTIARLKRREQDELERKKRIPMRYIPVLDLMKKHPGMGPMQIRDYIRKHLGLSMGVNSIRKIMEQSGWVPPFVKTTRVTDGMQFYEAARKNYLWHMDFKHQYINKCKVFILFIQDDHSRFIVGHTIADGEKIDVVLIAVEESIRIYGKPESIMTDGGSAFFSWRGSSKFTRFLEDYGIEQLIAQTPNINGKLENLNQQVEKELLIVTDFASVDHFKNELAKWVGFYNFTRVHQGLGELQVPADRYFPGAKKWYGESTDQIKQQSLIAETMATLLNELKKPK